MNAFFINGIGGEIYKVVFPTFILIWLCLNFKKGYRKKLDQWVFYAVKKKRSSFAVKSPCYTNANQLPCDFPGLF